MLRTSTRWRRLPQGTAAEYDAAAPFGRSVAATVPFAVMWVIALAYSVSQIFEYGDKFQCEAELCTPGFDFF